MKLYMYISQAVKLSQLSKILATAKQYNGLHGITGVMSYNRGYYLQIIEGNSEKVSNLMKNIRNDSRHKDICTVLEIDTQCSYFREWPMHLEPNLMRCDPFLELIKEKEHDLNLLSFKQKKLLDLFCSRLDSKNNLAIANSDKASLTYSISKWPDFSSIEPSKKMLFLCAFLHNNPTGFKNILSKVGYETENDLRLVLKKLNSLKCLTVSYVQEEKSINQVELDEQPNFFERVRDSLNIRVT